MLAGIGKVETGHGTSKLPGVHSGENYAGAGGPMQFLLPTWKQFGVDGDRDGDKDRYDPADAIPGAANYLRHNHGNEGGEKLRKAIWFYNHSWDYVDLVLSWAKKYTDGQFTVGGDNNAGQECAPGAIGGGPFGQRVVAYATRYLKTPYLWGGGNEKGPNGHACAHGVCGKGFDCSGLTMYAVAQASGMKIILGHYTGNQINDRRGTRVGFGQLQPGDLVFFTHPGESVPHHVGIYRGGGNMIHAPRTGDWVKISNITTGYYRSEFAGESVSPCPVGKEASNDPVPGARWVLPSLLVPPLMGVFACAPVERPSGQAPPSKTMGSPSATAPRPTTPPARSGERPAGRLPDPKRLDWMDAGAVSKAAITVMWTVDSCIDSGQRDAYLRARPYMTPQYARAVARESATATIPAEWREHRAYARVRLTPQKPESGTGPDTPSLAHRQWRIVVSAVGRDGWKGPGAHAIAFVTLVRPGPRTPWRVSAVVSA